MGVRMKPLQSVLLMNPWKTQVNFNVIKCDLFINQEHPWMHATPDFLCSCVCCREGSAHVLSRIHFRKWKLSVKLPKLLLLLLSPTSQESVKQRKKTTKKKSGSMTGWQGGRWWGGDNRLWVRAQDDRRISWEWTVENSTHLWINSSSR